MIKIVIPHRVSPELSINTAPYHRWEHLFVNILQKSAEVHSATGMTTIENTELYVQLAYDNPETISRCINKIRYGRVSAKEFIIESIIIDNELQCMEMVYRRKIGRCENGQVLGKKDMYGFRHNNYLWSNIHVICDVTQEVMHENYIGKERSQDRISLIRSRMMHYFKNTSTLDSILKCEGGAFVLYRVKCMEGLLTPEQCKRIAETLDLPKGVMWSKLKRHYAQSFMLWPSAEEHEFKGFQLFTFIRVNRIKSFWDLLMEYIMSFPVWEDADKAHVIEHFSSPMVMICSI